MSHLLTSGILCFCKLELILWVSSSSSIKSPRSLSAGSFLSIVDSSLLTILRITVVSHSPPNQVMKVKPITLFQKFFVQPATKQEKMFVRKLLQNVQQERSKIGSLISLIYHLISRMKIFNT